jgi:hypothetical protein
MKLTAKKLKNGALYYNTKSQRVERMLGTLNTNRVWTTSHDSKPEANKCSTLRFANGQEVETYLQASQRWNDISAEKFKAAINKVLPPLPRQDSIANPLGAAQQ